MHFSKTNTLTTTAVFLAAGILFPIFFHLVSLGKIMMPMYWPIAMAAFMLPGPYAVLISLITPLLSMILTGMPPLSPPIMQMMMAELLIMTVTIVFFRSRPFKPVLILILGLFASRVMVFIISPAFEWIFGLPAGWFAYTRQVESLPGIIGMVLFIPPLLKRMTNRRLQ